MIDSKFKQEILVINSPIFEDKNDSNKEDYLPPLGLGIITTNLKSNGFEVKFIDSIAENRSIKDILNTINDSKPSSIAINVFSTNYKNVKKIVESVKIKTKFIIGGISTRTLYEEIFKWETENKINIVYGDGEIIISQIINNNTIEQPSAEKDTKRFFIVSKNSKYYVKDISNDKLDRKLFINEPHTNIDGLEETCIYTSRGCTYNCAYCSAACTLNKEIGVRNKTKSSIISELREIRNDFPNVQVIRILDDLFLQRKSDFQQAKEIFDQFSFSWRAMCHINSLYVVDKDILEGLKSSGCSELFVGIESGSNRILRKIHKHFDRTRVIEAISKALNSGIKIKGYFILGIPTEDQNDMDQTYDLANSITILSKNLKTNFRNSTFRFKPYHGTELYNEIIKDRKIESEKILSSFKQSKLLDDEIDRKSFSFYSGNYSRVSEDILESYLHKMNELNKIR